MCELRSSREGLSSSYPTSGNFCWGTVAAGPPDPGPDLGHYEYIPEHDLEAREVEDAATKKKKLLKKRRRGTLRRLAQSLAGSQLHVRPRRRSAPRTSLPTRPTRRGARSVWRERPARTRAEGASQLKIPWCRSSRWITSSTAETARKWMRTPRCLTSPIGPPPGPHQFLWRTRGTGTQLEQFVDRLGYDKFVLQADQENETPSPLWLVRSTAGWELPGCVFVMPLAGHTKAKDPWTWEERFARGSPS